MKRLYTKTPLALDEQLRRLERRGVRFADREAARSVLENVNYYRLSGYWHIFKDTDDSFRRADAFDLAWKLYTLDRELRMLVSEAAETVEISFRSRIAHHLAMHHGPFAHEDDRAWDRRAHAEAARWREVLHRETLRSTAPFALHFKREYAEWPKLPVWVACELMSFGTLSRLYKGMRIPDQTAIARPFDLPRKVLASWLHVIVYVRNIAAHHGRLWNRTFSIKGKVPKSAPWPQLGVGRELDRSYGALCAFRVLTRRIDVDASHRWALRVVDLLDRFPGSVDGVRRLGAPDDWNQRAGLWPVQEAPRDGRP